MAITRRGGESSTRTARQDVKGHALPTKFGPIQEVTNSIGLKLVLMPAGEFRMGAPDDEKGRQDNEIPQHPVRITQPFWLGVYEVTEEEYPVFDGASPESLLSVPG